VSWQHSAFAVFNGIGKTRVQKSAKFSADLGENCLRSLCQFPVYIAAPRLTAIQKYSIGALRNVAITRAKPSRNCIYVFRIICTTSGWQKTKSVANPIRSWFAVAMATDGKPSRAKVASNLHGLM